MIRTTLAAILAGALLTATTVAADAAKPKRPIISCPRPIPGIPYTCHNVDPLRWIVTCPRPIPGQPHQCRVVMPRRP